MTPSDTLHLDEHLARLLAAYDQGIGDGEAEVRGPTLDFKDLPLSSDERLVEPLSGSQVNRGSLGELLPDPPTADPFLAGKPFPETHRIGRFELRRQLGKGGCGIVFLAFDPKLKREVALKIPRPELFTSLDARRRLLREATAAAGFDHPNLVPVYETGEIGPVCFIATVFCPGQTLSEWLDRQAFPVPIRQAARLVAQVAEAVQHAHDRSVLHRDLKPNNIILQEVRSDPNAQDPPLGSCPLRGEHFIPRVVDFGLAKLTDQGPSETATRQIIGTPKYMAPEQAQARHDDVGPEADVYALGVILYEMLAGRTPYDGETDVEVLRLSIEGNMTLPRSLRREIPRDLEAICLKAMARSPTRRYRTAIDLADDLRRFLEGLPTLARPLNAVGRAARWLRRNDQAFALVTVSSISCILLAIGMWNAYQTQKYQVVQNESQVRDAERLRTDAHRNYSQHVRNAFFAWQAGDSEAHAASLKKAQLAAGAVEMPEFAFRYLAGVERSEGATLRGLAAPAVQVASRPDGQECAVAFADGAVELFARSGSRKRFDPQGRAPLRAMVYPEAGPPIGVELNGKLATVWEFGESLRIAFRTEVRGTTAELSGTNGWVAIGDERGQVTVWSIADREVKGSFSTGRNAPVRHLAFSDNGFWLATPTTDQVVGIWYVSDPAVRQRLSIPADGLWQLRFLGNDRIITTGPGSAIKIWNMSSTLEERAMFGHVGRITSLAVSPDQRTLMSGGAAGEVKLWDLRTGQEVVSLNRHGGAVLAAEFSAEGRNLITAGAGTGGRGDLAFWDSVKE